MKNILLLLLINSLSYAMENDNLHVAAMPCVEKIYVDYIVTIIYFNKTDIPFPYLKQTKEQAIEHLNKRLVSTNPYPAIKVTDQFVSLLRIYDNPQGLEPLLNEGKKSPNEIEEKLLKIGAEQGKWPLAEAIEKIKQHGGKSNL